MKYKIGNSNISIEVDDFGAELSSIKYNNIEYLWQKDPQYWGSSAPTLFPICGSIRDDVATIGNDKICTMPRHGIVRKRNFELTNHKKTEITFRISEDKETIKMYPYRFSLYVTYQLEDKTLKVIYKICNNDKENMPYFIGGHPGFNVPLSKGEHYEDYIIEFLDEMTVYTPSPIQETGLVDRNNRNLLLNNDCVLPLKKSLFKNDGIIFDNITSKELKLYNPKTHQGIVMKYPSFNNLVLWSNNQGEFIAIEPWSGMSTYVDEDDIFEHKENIRVLSSQMYDVLEFEITIL